MPKTVINTDKLSISISKDVNRMLSDYCKNNLINKSRLVNKLIRDFFDKKAFNKNNTTEDEYSKGKQNQ